MQRRKNSFKRVAAYIISVAIMISLLGGMTFRSPGTQTLSAAPGVTYKVADGDTSDSYLDFLDVVNNSKSAGRIWADKSVFTSDISLNMETDGYTETITNDGDFLHAFSTLGSSQVIHEETPLDVLFVVDISGSMAEDRASNSNLRGSRIYNTVNAINACIALLMQNPDSRVAISLYGDHAVQFLPLLRFDTTSVANNGYISATGGSGDYIRLQANGNISLLQDDNTWSAPASAQSELSRLGYNYRRNNDDTGHSTNLQSGLAAGFEILANEKTTTWVSDVTQQEYGRIPVVIAMTDGANNILSPSKDGTNANAWWNTAWNRSLNSSQDDSNVPHIGAIAMTAAYGMAATHANYSKSPEPIMYGVGLDIGSNAIANSTLDPSKNFTADSTITTGRNAYNKYLSWYEGSGTVNLGKVNGHSVDLGQLPEGNPITKEDVNDHIYYVKKGNYIALSNGGDITTRFVEIINNVRNQAFIPVSGSNDAGVNNTITYIDPIGDYMKVDSIKGLLLFGQMYDLAPGSLVYYKYNEGGEDTVGSASSYDYYRQYYTITPKSGNQVQNPCYGTTADGSDSDVYFDLSSFTIYVETTNGFRDVHTDSSGLESDSGYGQALYMSIPATALPMQVANVTIQEAAVPGTDSGLDGYDVVYETNMGNDPANAANQEAYYKQSTPLRLFYTVSSSLLTQAEGNGIDLSAVTQEYIEANKRDGVLYFYPNWYMENSYNGYASGNTYTYGDPVITFSPNITNSYYYSTIVEPLFEMPAGSSGAEATLTYDDGGNPYADGTALSYITSKDKVSEDATYYMPTEYYARTQSGQSAANYVRHVIARKGSELGCFAMPSSGESGMTDHLCWLDLVTLKSEDWNDGTAPETPGTWVVAAKSGTARLGNLERSVSQKENNSSNTAQTYYLPTISSSSEHENMILNVYLGNNGVMGVDDTLLMVAKVIDASADEMEENNAAEEDFNFQVYVEGMTGSVNAVLVRRNPYTSEWQRRIDNIDLMTDNEGFLLDQDNPSQRAKYNGSDIWVGANTAAPGEANTYRVYSSGAAAGGVTTSTDDATGITSFYMTVRLGGESGMQQDNFLIGTLDPRQSGSNIKMDIPYLSQTTYMMKQLTFGVNEMYDGNQFTLHADNDTYKQTVTPSAANTASFTLKDGEGILLPGLHSGAAYKVTEKIPDDQAERHFAFSGLTHTEQDASTTYGNAAVGKDPDMPSSTTDNTALDYGNNVFSVFGDTGAKEEDVYFTNGIILETQLSLGKIVDAAEGTTVNEKDKNASFTFDVELVAGDIPENEVHLYMHSQQDGSYKENPDYVYKDGDDEYAKYLLPVTFVDGHATFTLKAEEEIRITDLLATKEYKYRITETPVTGYNGIVEGGTAGTGGSVAEGVINRERRYEWVRFSNVKQAPAPVTVPGIDISKTFELVNGTLPGEGLTFNFTLTPSKDNPASDPITGEQTVSTTFKETGSTTVSPRLFNDTTYTEAGTYIYTIKEEPENPFRYARYDEVIYTMTVTVSEDYGEGDNAYQAALKADVSFKDNRGNAASAPLSFHNVADSRQTSVFIEGVKNFIHGSNGETNEGFQFVLSPVSGVMYEDVPEEVTMLGVGEEEIIGDEMQGDDEQATPPVEPTDEPAADATPEPDVEQTPEGQPTEQPEATEQPADTEQPEPTDEPAESTPEPTEEPAPTDEPQDEIEEKEKKEEEPQNEAQSDGGIVVASLASHGMASPAIQMSRIQMTGHGLRAASEEPDGSEIIVDVTDQTSEDADDTTPAEDSEVTQPPLPTEETDDSAEPTEAPVDGPQQQPAGDDVPQDNEQSQDDELLTIGDDPESEIDPMALTEVVLEPRNVPMPDSADFSGELPTATATSTSGGLFRFDSINYFQSGRYVYKVVEVASGDSGIRYDTSPLYVIVTVSKDEDTGIMSAIRQYAADPDGNQLLDKLEYYNFRAVKDVALEPGTKVGSGTELEFSIAWGNYHHSEATVTVTDKLDEGVTYLECSSGGNYDPATRTVTWTMPNAAPGDEGVVTVKVQVNDSGRDLWDYENGSQEGVDGKVINRATVQVDNDSDVTNTVEVPMTDEIPKQGPVKTETAPGDGVEVPVGTELTYTISWQNYKDYATTITITDPLDKGVEFVSASDGGSYDPDTRTVKWTLEGCPSSGTGTVTLTVKVTEAALETNLVKNKASVQVADDEPQDTNEPQNPVSIPKQTPHKTVTKPGEGVSVEAGEQITYAISWQNYQLANSTITIRDPLDANVRFLHASDDGYYDAATHTVTWTLEDREPWAQGTVSVIVQVLESAQQAGAVKNKAYVSVGNDQEVETEEPQNPVNIPEKDPVKTETTPGAGADAKVGTDISYTISWQNFKGSPATITITDPLDAGVELVTASEGYSYDAASHTVTWTLNNCQPGAEGTVSLTVRVTTKAHQMGKVVNQATVRVDNGQDKRTNEIENPVPVPPPAKDPHKVETAPGAGLTAKVGTEIDYSISWHNYKEVPATVTITDKLDAGVEFVEASEGSSYDPDYHTVTWTLDDCEPGEEGFVTLTVKVAEAALETNLVKNQASVRVDDDQEKLTESPENPVPAPIPEEDPHKIETAPGEETKVKVGDKLSYTISYQNYKDTAATITIIDKLDAGVKFVEASEGSSYDETSHTVTWTLNDVASAEKGTVSITVEVAEAALETNLVKNQASVRVDDDQEKLTESPENPVPTPIEVKEPTKSLNGAEDGALVAVGQELTYTITWQNYKDAPAAITIRDPLDKNVQYLSSSDNGIYDAATHTVRWVLTNRPSAEEGFVTVTVRVLDAAADAGSVKNLAYVSVDNDDEVQTNEPQNPVIKPESPHKTVTDPGDGESMRVGQELTYEITWKNNTAADATFTVRDPLDTGVEFVEASDDGVYDEASHTVTWTFADQQPGETKSVTLTVRVTGAALDTALVKNAAYISENGGQETKTEEPYNPVLPQEAPHKVLNGIDDGTTVKVGQEVSYDITWINSTAADATVTITDPLDAGVEFVKASDGGSYDKDTRTVTWTLDAKPEEEGKVTVTVRVTKDALADDARIENEATVQIADLPEQKTEKPSNPVSPIPSDQPRTGDRGKLALYLVLCATFTAGLAYSGMLVGRWKRRNSRG